MINITIQITGEELGEVERAVLAALAGTNGEYAVNPPAQDIAEYKGETVEDIHKAFSGVKRTRRTKAEMEAARAAEAAPEAPTYVPEGADDSVTGSELAEEPAVPSGATLDDAVKLATELVAANRTTDLKQALVDIGAKRVSELKGEQIGVFIGKFAA